MLLSPPVGTGERNAGDAVCGRARIGVGRPSFVDRAWANCCASSWTWAVWGREAESVKHPPRTPALRLQVRTHLVVPGSHAPCECAPVPPHLANDEPRKVARPGELFAQFGGALRTLWRQASSVHHARARRDFCVDHGLPTAMLKLAPCVLAGRERSALGLDAFTDERLLELPARGGAICMREPIGGRDGLCVPLPPLAPASSGPQCGPRWQSRGPPPWVGMPSTRAWAIGS